MNIFSYLVDEAQNESTQKKVKTTPPSLYYRWWIFAMNEHTIMIIIKWWKKWKCEKNLLHLVIIIRSMQRYIYCYCVLGFAINWSERRVVDIVVMLAKLKSAGRVSCMPVATRHYTNALDSGTLAQFRFLSLHWAELFFLSFGFFSFVGCLKGNNIRCFGWEGSIELIYGLYLYFGRT